MFQAKNNTKHLTYVGISLLSLSFLLQTGCGGGTEGSEPGVDDIAIAYVKRRTPRDNNGNIENNDIRIPVTFAPGGDLYYQTRTTPNAPVKNITARLTNGQGDVQAVNVSYDGNKLVFSMRLEDPDPNDNVTPSWNLYEYEISTDSITQLTDFSDPNTTVNLLEDDISPHYLPSGDIIFSSNRQIESKAIRRNEQRGDFTSTDENHRNTAYLLHVRNQDDGSIKQVSFNQSHDLDPTILSDSGRVLFSRWNHMGGRNDVSLYTMTPDGTDVKMYYGSHSHNTGQANNTAAYSNPREMDDGRILAILRPLVTTFGGGDMVVIDAKNFADNTQPTWEQQGAVTGSAQTVLSQNVVNSLGIALQGRYNSIFPMLDESERYLMSWTPCQILENPADPNSTIIPCSLASSQQLNDPNVTEAPPHYGIFLYNPNNKTQLPLVRPESDTIFSNIVMAYSRKVPPIVNSSSDLDSSLATNGIGILHIRSVYDFDYSFASYNVALPAEKDVIDINDAVYGPEFDADTIINRLSEIANPKNTLADERPARFIRITKGAYIPPLNIVDLANTAFGDSTQQGMREIIGYAPIEPDGSVKIKVPADVPLTLSILDKDGRRISNRHQSWFQVRPGETLECIGCHVHNTQDQASNKPHGRISQPYTLNQGAPSTPFVFRNSQNTLWAEYKETMADARTRKDESVMQPSIDLIYADVWTNDVAANRSADASFSIDYSGTPVSPETAACADPYNNTLNSFTYCRIVINYEEHIQPIWEKTRGVAGVDTCTSCHTATAQAHIDAAQLELTKNTIPIQNPAPDNYISYQELFNNDLEQNADGTEKTVMVLQDILINGQTVDNLPLPNGDGIPDQALITIPDPNALVFAPSMSTNGALASRVFMELMTGTDLDNDMGNQPTDTRNHNLMLTPSELKLISEWLDIGAQYYNNPRHANVPLNM